MTTRENGILLRIHLKGVPTRARARKDTIARRRA